MEDVDIATLGEERLAQYRRRKVGLIYQFYNLIPTLSVKKNICLPMLLDNKEPGKERFDDIVRTLGLGQLGSVMLTEATLSFLGLGVKFPFASWGNIINDVKNSYVLTNYWFIWIPAGVCLSLAVLGFNFVGDGLRDAFDPRMKR